VVVNPAITDRELGKELCDGCKQGKYNVCSRMSYYGFSAACGGLSDEMVVNSMNVFKIPNHIPLEIGALVEPLSVAWHSVSRSKFSAGQNALILGSGPIGLGLILVLKIFGANKIIVSEIAEQRAQQAVNFGATAVVNPLQQDILKEVTTICGSKVDISYEATGLQTTLDTALDCTRPGGTVYNIAIHEKALSLNPNQLVENEIYYTAGNSYTHEDIYSVVDALATGKVDPRAMITSVVPLEKGVEDGIMELVNNREKHVKILVKPGA
jgi:(R,R)-butanediol dehydrogenase/meso-butanediol dehydrogenase/diacetyl reductase